MTIELFIQTINKIRAIEDRLNKIDEVAGTVWTESVIGDMFDIFYDVLIPGAKDDGTWERFGEILFEPNVTDEDIEDFYNEYKESLD